MKLTRGGRKRAPSARTNWNTVLLEEIRLAGLPEPIREYVFHANRNWRFDFCWREGGLLVACEVCLLYTSPSPRD